MVSGADICKRALVVAQINGLERIFQAVLLIYFKAEANARRDEDIALVEHDALIRKLLAP